MASLGLSTRAPMWPCFWRRVSRRSPPERMVSHETILTFRLRPAYNSFRGNDSAAGPARSVSVALRSSLASLFHLRKGAVLHMFSRLRRWHETLLHQVIGLPE